ncbi:carbohydrate deacetylase [Enterococcus faecalis]|uniref:carbohydrate deacetylase n=1 Tax=Enterococcus faecalis TaxID=1351 RepID=UPI001144C1C5|nr:carbohydrate deacetylase [Enterococcus faecalis]NSW10294.1 carbohydrate deacetylase [Enterococcus faecalis]TQB30332.1 carbohydrate deacetylase [Enterococcus faecalis]
MSLLIINADDFGYSEGINYGIIDSFKNGILTSTTLMANMPGFDHAVKLAKENPELGIGVHLTLTCDQPVLDSHRTIVDEQNFFNKLYFYEGKFSIDYEELYREWKAQIEKVIHAGIKPTHLDSHHHVNTIPGITEVFVKLAEEYDLPVRGNFNVPGHLITCDRFFNNFDGLGLDKDIWKMMTDRNLVEDCLNYKTVEVMCHPGYVDAELLDRFSFTDGRPYICRELQEKKYKKLFAEKNIKLGTYHEIMVSPVSC